MRITLVWRFVIVVSNNNFSSAFYHSNIKVLDFANNNISEIQPGYFKPAEMSLTHLYLGHNKLTVSGKYPTELQNPS